MDESESHTNPAPSLRYVDCTPACGRDHMKTKIVFPTLVATAILLLTASAIRSAIGVLSHIAVIACVVLALSSTVEAQSSVIRLQVVNVPVDSGLLATLLPDFERTTGYRVDVQKGEQVYAMARQGLADLVLSHYGHAQVDDFMADGLGL